MACFLPDHRTAGSSARMDVVTPDSAPSQLDPDALRNLIENALIHFLADMPVMVQLLATGRFAVSDEAVPVPAGRLAELPRRFERAETGGPGSGLGLAIAESMARAARGRLELSLPIPGRADGFRAVFSSPEKRMRRARRCQILLPGTMAIRADRGAGQGGVFPYSAAKAGLSTRSSARMTASTRRWKVSGLFAVAAT
ncbi:sensor histidine kinase [Paracoccus sp. SSJ]|uniref:ATP-binding protein n=1 Tax=Paracoccus sp. SSJ TaxID=3050636 RepID=UPI0025504AE9|nr:sensor histidine kinase [Paracoccus sp. SSJ]MDK8871266.1 sensor histidine kinase [Paracoccus sp. SSJ]